MHECQAPFENNYKTPMNPGWWIIRINAVYIVLFFLWTRFHWGGEQYKILIGNLAYIPVHVFWIVMWWRTAIHPALPSRTRRGWQILTVAALCNFIASCITWGYVELVLQQQSFPILTNSDNADFEWFIPSAMVLYIVCPLLLLGSTLLTEKLKNRAEIFKFSLDTGIMFIGIGTPIWYFLIRPILVDRSPSEAVLLLQYPGTTLALLFIILVILLKGSGPRDNSPLQWLALGILVDCIADTMFNYLIQENAYQTGDSVDTLYLVGGLLMMTGAQLEYVHASTGGAASLTERYDLFKSLPYPAVLVAYGLLLAVAYDYWENPWREPLGGLIFAAVILITLLVIRQAIVYKENIKLRIKQTKHESEAHFVALVRQSSDLIAITDSYGIIRFISPSVQNLLGYDFNQLKMTSWLDLLHPDDQNRGHLFFQDTLQKAGADGLIEWRVRRYDQSWMHAETVASNRLDDPIILGIILNSRDISERRALENQIWQQAHYDSLTQLANRVLFQDRLEHAIKRVRRNQQPLAVMFLDLDNFKAINDNLGHSVGDQLLVDIARRLVHCTRDCDTVARLGGDEFAILIEETFSFEDLTQLAERIIETLCILFKLEKEDMLVTVSIGIAIDNGDQEINELLSNADRAMYAAKSRGKKCYEFFNNARFPSSYHREFR